MENLLECMFDVSGLSAASVKFVELKCLNTNIDERAVRPFGFLPHRTENNLFKPAKRVRILARQNLKAKPRDRNVTDTKIA